ncbi:MAG: tetratricopeptide repeat protein [Leptolyngbyaceae cyanobacterium SL_7_1]|nr:tetratricopeptide repeat protein [Leptolyngbyaceae cyanobacterium SL_7_1]
MQTLRQGGDAIGVGCALNNLAVLYGIEGEADRSHPLILAALTAFQHTAQQAEEAVVHYNGGELMVAEHPDLAFAYWRRASAIWTALGDFEGEAIAFRAMGDAHHHLGRPFHALSCYQEAVELQRSIGNWAAEAAVLEQVAEVYQEEGMPLSAIDQLHRSLAVFQFIGDRVAADRLLCRLGKLYESLDELAAAMECYQQVLESPTNRASAPPLQATPRVDLSNVLFHPNCPIAS